MQRFAELWVQLERTAEPASQRQTLAHYFAQAAPADAAWALRLLHGQRPRRVLPADTLRALAGQLSGLPAWLYAETEAAAADPLDAAALLLGRTAAPAGGPTLHAHMQRLQCLHDAAEPALQAWAQEVWPQLSVDALRLVLRLAAGTLRRRIRQHVLAGALASVAERPAWLMARELAGHPGSWDAADYQRLLAATADMPPPDAFHLVTARFDPARPPSPASAWCALPEGGGLRVQLLRRSDCLLWSIEGEFIQRAAPTIVRAGLALPTGTVIEGEWIRPDRGGGPQLRAADLLEHAGDDLRRQPFGLRRQRLTDILAPLAAGPIVLLPCRHLHGWDALQPLWQDAAGATALILRRLDAPFVPAGADRRLRYLPPAGTVQAVLLYARLDGPVPELSLGIRDGSRLVPIARDGAQLPTEQQQSLIRWIRSNTTDRFGPVVAVPPEQVFTLRFQAVRRSRRHKAGLRLEHPEIAAWQRNRPPAAIDELQALLALLQP